MVGTAGDVTATAAAPLTAPLVAATVAVPTADAVNVTVAPLGISVTTPAGVTDHVTAALGISCPF
jgi:hypothetical protein